MEPLDKAFQSRRGYLELPLKRLNGHGLLSGEETAAIRHLPGMRSNVAKGSAFEAAEATGVYFVLEGWVARERIAPSGRRQMFEFALPGDVVGQLPGIYGAPVHSLRALSKVTLVEAASLLEILPDGSSLHPGIVHAFASFSRDRHERLVEHVVRLTSRNAYQSIGHLMLELFHRYVQVGLNQNNRFPFLVGQTRVGELLGLSAVHVNRSFKRLRDEGHVLFKRGWAELPDHEGLARLVDYPLDQPERLRARLLQEEAP